MSGRLLVNGVEYESFDAYQRKTYGDPIDCFVYFIQAAPQTYKIGSTVDLARRLADLQRDKDYPLVVTAIVRTYTYPRSEAPLEGAIHQHLSRKRILGEWFRLTDEEIDSVLESFGGERL